MNGACIDFAILLLYPFKTNQYCVFVCVLQTPKQASLPKTPAQLRGFK